MDNIFRIEEKNGDRKVYANIPIEKHTVICIFKGSLIDYKATLDMGENESFALQIAPDVYIYLEPPGRYFNHCCEPNCGLKDMNLVALEDIAKNDELRWDYSTSMLEHHWSMKCSCHKPACRKVIGDFNLLPKTLQNKYVNLQIVQPFIVKALHL